ncbi:Urm1-domain-containing protein [Poronia punctata]|nr:Urm1-domain-containing protein [Poronia punctata]
MATATAAVVTMKNTTPTDIENQTTGKNNNNNKTEPGTSKLSIIVEFSGGLEMLFSDQRKHILSIPDKGKNDRPANISHLIDYLCENTMKDTRKELFVLDGHLRPGILVLINDADWELEGEEAYELQDGDNILFVSTLHGG